jgi:predicted nucleic acid-binding protein
MPVRVMIDTHIYDVVAADSEMKALIERRQLDGQIKLISTHIEAGELAKIPGDRDIGQATAVNTERVGAAVFVLDYSKLDEDRLGTEEANSAFSQIQKNNLRHTEDAMIGATALIEVDILVTDDDRFKRKFAALKSDIKMMSADEFGIYLRSLS